MLYQKYFPHRSCFNSDDLFLDKFEGNSTAGD